MYLNILRMFLILVTNHIIFVILLNQFLPRKRSLIPLSLYLLTKIVVLNTWLGMVMREYYTDVFNNSAGYQFAYTFGTWLAAILTFVAVKWTFDISVQKLMIVALVVDVLATCFGHTGVFVVDLIAGRKLTFSESGTIPIQWIDLLIPVISLSFLWLVLRILSPWTEKIRSYEVKHKKIMTVIFCLYIVMVTQPLVTHTYSDSLAVSLTICVGLAVIMLMGAYILSRYQRNILREKEFLPFQGQLMSNYYAKMKEQETQLQSNQKILKEQMEKITQQYMNVNKTNNTDIEINSNDIIINDGKEINKDSNKGNAENSNINKYLNELKTEYQQLKQGTYCNDMMLDAILSSQAEIMTKEDIIFDCFLQTYQKGNLDLKDIASVVLFLLDYGIRENCKLEEDRKISLHMSAIRNQLVITYETNTAKKSKLKKKQILSFISGYENTIECEMTEKCAKINIMIENSR